MNKRPLLCGHRGTGETAPGNPFPENTLSSILRAIDEGAEMVEFDVLLSADGVPVLMHDDTVDRTTDGTGCVSALSLRQLRELDVGVGSGQQGVRIDTLAEVLAAVSIPLNVEVKVADAPCPVQDRRAYARSVLGVLAADPAHGRRLLVSSFDIDLLIAMRELAPETELGWLWDKLPPPSDGDVAARDEALLRRAKAEGFVAVHPNHEDITAAFVDSAADAGLEVNTWTVNAEHRMRELLPLGLGAIITDDPTMLARVMADSAR